TRHQTLGTLAEMLDVPPLSQDEGMHLLLQRARRLGKPLTSAEAEAAVAVGQLLTELPLGLDQAGAYIDEAHCSIAAYLLRYQQQRKFVLARRGMHGGAHPDSVATTLLLSVAHIEREHPAAADLLRFCVFLHAEAIPEEMLIAAMADLAATPNASDLIP